MEKRFFTLLLSFFLLLTACGQGNDNTPEQNGADNVPPATVPDIPPVTTDPPQMPEAPVLSEKELAVEALLEDMTLEEKVGQLFFVRCPAENAVEDISTYHLGGYLLFGRDFKDKTAATVQSTIASYQEAAEIPLLIGADEEGGTVVRISSQSALWPHKFLSPSGSMPRAAWSASLLIQRKSAVCFTPTASM